MLVRNKGNFCIVLKKCFLFREHDVIRISDEIGCCNLKADIEVELPAGSEYPIVVTCLSKEKLGCYSADVIFTFERIDVKRSKFHLLRLLECRRTSDLSETLKAESEYKRPSMKFNRDNLIGITFAEKKPTLAGNKLITVRKVAKYSIPTELHAAIKQRAFSNGYDKGDYKDIRDTVLSELSLENYAQKFSLLLFLEEIQQVKDRKFYDMQNVTIAKTKSGQNYKLQSVRRCLKDQFLICLHQLFGDSPKEISNNPQAQVPGLLEKRPSVVVGDSILVKILGPNGQIYEKDAQGKAIAYKGWVRQVEADVVTLSFHERFNAKYVSNMKFSVHFEYNPYPTRLQYRAINSLITDEQFNLLFPKTDVERQLPFPSSTSLATLYDRNIEQNVQQLEAVKNIVFGKSRLPYIIFGPPGTGKTVTMVEAIKQVTRLYPNSHVLVCAPSNSATDLLTERLKPHIDKAILFRMCAQSRVFTDGKVPLSIQDVCNYNQANHEFFFPTKEELMKYRVLCTTLTTAGRLASAVFPDDHFDFVFVDEAGFATEPELLIPIAGILKIGGRLIMAGDPKQLGPIIFSSLAKRFGLGKSLLERLHESFNFYEKNDDDHYDNRYITKLLKNYRNHPDILHVPNLRFYESELEVCADKFIRNLLCGWDELPRKNFPVIFHAVNGKEEREATSPSYFNAEEAVVVFEYMKKLLEQRGNGITAREIGVISPYRKQCKKILKLIKELRLSDPEKIKVGSVEEFQGQERRVIIISTVRSDTKHFVEDLKQQLGFLANPKRMNVAITRAQSLLIVVGNPKILCNDPNWRHFMEYCFENGGTAGFRFNPFEEKVDDDLHDIIHNLSSFGFSYDDEDNNDFSGMTSFIQPTDRM